MQSSAVTTSIIVGMVAAPDNPLPISNAIPMILGANIGAAVTHTLVALAHIGRPDEFRRALATATCHDFSKLLAVAALLPLEMLFSPLQKGSAILSHGLGTGAAALFSPVSARATTVTDRIDGSLSALFPDALVPSALLLALSVATVVATLLLLVRVLRRLAGGRTQVYLSQALDSNPYAGMGVGAALTVMAQSSRVTLAVLVPLAGSGIVTLAQAFPVTLGAALGGTVTTLLASLGFPAETAALGMQIATVHVLFNTASVMLIYPIAPLRRLPLSAAMWLGEVGSRSKRLAILYVLGLFYGVPALVVVMSRVF
jgi:sodium-dependent phosphate cotransporter